MNTAKLMILPLAAMLALPAVAQQQETQASSPQVQAEQPAQSEETTRQPLEMEPHEGFWGKLNPFARKKYVQRQIEPIQDRADELDELTARNAKHIKEMDARFSAEINQASEKASLADERAGRAQQQADLAHGTAQQAAQRLQLVQMAVENADHYQPVTEVEIRFRAGQSKLSGRAEEALNEVVKPLKEEPGYVVEIRGFAPGGRRQSLEASQRMADAVARYLVIEHDIPLHRIFVTAMGNASLPGEENAGNRRRVLVSLLSNGVATLNSQPMPGMASTSGAATPESHAPEQAEEPVTPQKP